MEVTLKLVNLLTVAVDDFTLLIKLILKGPYFIGVGQIVLLYLFFQPLDIAFSCWDRLVLTLDCSQMLRTVSFLRRDSARLLTNSAITIRDCLGKSINGGLLLRIFLFKRGDLRLMVKEVLHLLGNSRIVCCIRGLMLRDGFLQSLNVSLFTWDGPFLIRHGGLLFLYGSLIDLYGSFMSGNLALVLQDLRLLVLHGGLITRDGLPLSGDSQLLVLKEFLDSKVFQSSYHLETVSRVHLKPKPLISFDGSCFWGKEEDHLRANYRGNGRICAGCQDSLKIWSVVVVRLGIVESLYKELFELLLVK